MSKGARDNEDAQSFGYRFDDDLTQRRASTSTGVIGTAYDNASIPGFQAKMVVGFKPMLGLFNQFKYIPLKACPLVLELELVSNLLIVLLNLVLVVISPPVKRRLMISKARAVNSN